MPGCLDDVTLPKTYQNGEILFEEDLDVWRLKTEELFSIVNLDFSQIIKDAFGNGYQLDCDGNSNLPLSLQDQISQLQGGGANIQGTISDTFTINTDGDSATLDTSLLTQDQTYFFPDCSGTFLLSECVQNVTGAKTFFPSILKILASGGGIGVATFELENTNVDYLFTLPDLGVDGTFMFLEGIQIVTGPKQFTQKVFITDPGDAITILQGSRINLDGDETTSIRSIADNIIITQNGLDTILINDNGELNLPDIDPPLPNSTNRNGNIKVWANIQANGTSNNDYNITAINKLGTGLYQHVIDTNFTLADSYGGAASYTGVAGNITVNFRSSNAGSYNVLTFSAGVSTDLENASLAIGDQ